MKFFTKMLVLFLFVFTTVMIIFDKRNIDELKKRDKILDDQLNNLKGNYFDRS